MSNSSASVHSSVDPSSPQTHKLEVEFSPTSEYYTEKNEITELPEEPTFQQKIHTRLHAWGLPIWLIQLFLFGLIGASGIVVDLGVAVFCREVFNIGVQYGIYPAFVMAVTWNFELNRRITFDSRHIQWWYAYLTFFLACTVGLLVRLGFIYFAIDKLGFDDRFLSIGSITVPYLRLSYVAYIGGIIIAYIFNFLASKFVAFRPNRTN